jgi:hypothetical protein
MKRIDEDEVRENRISMEIVVDTYDEEERNMGWYYYLEDKLRFPFKARCITTRRSSPLAEREEVNVAGMSPLEDCKSEMLVDIQWRGRTLAVPLSQLEGMEVDDETLEAIEDWHYWVNREYEF